MIKVAAHAEGKTLHEKLRELGTLYSYFIITDQPSNVLQGRVPDQISGNYNYKMGVSRIKKIGETKYKNEFTHMSFAPRNVV